METLKSLQVSQRLEEDGQNNKDGLFQSRNSPEFFIEYLTQNVIFHVKSHVTKHVF